MIRVFVCVCKTQWLLVSVEKQLPIKMRVLTARGLLSWQEQPVSAEKQQRETGKRRRSNSDASGQFCSGFSQTARL
jgi:hypothetical protein